MPPALAAADRQASKTAMWIWECAAFPFTCGTRDFSRPAVGGDPFVVGDSEVGGTDLVGGGAGPDAVLARARIIGEPTVTRRLVDAFWGAVEVQDVTIVFANADGALTGDYRGAAARLSRYDWLSARWLVEWTGLIAHGQRNRGTYTITGTNVDLAILEEPIPKGTVTLADFPLAAAAAVGACVPWVFGNVTNLPLLNVRDDLVRSEFDYLLCRGTAAALVALRRVTPGGANPFVEISFIELEPFPGMAGVLRNGGMETWALTTVPDTWALVGAGVTAAKNLTAGQFEEGNASASVTRAGTDGGIAQDLLANAPTLPLSWWRGRQITVTARARFTVAARGVLRLVDSAGSSASNVHTGGGTFELLSVTRTIDAAATSVAMRCLIEGGNTTGQFDDVRIYLKAKSWEEVLRPDLYPGSTALRFYLRQTDAGGAFHQIVADVNGLQAERNLVRAARTILSDATHGLGKAVDAASMDLGEVAVAGRYEEAVPLQASPQVLITFDRVGSLAVSGGTLPASFTLPDASGHRRHATVTNAGACSAQVGIGPSAGFTDFAMGITDGSAVSVPSSTAFDPTAAGWAIDGWYQPFALGLGVNAPVAEKLVGTAFESGLVLVHSNGQIFAEVNASGGLVAVGLSLTAADVNEWLYLAASAVDGILTLGIGRAGALTTATAAYTGTLPTGEGVFLIGDAGTGLAANATGAFTKWACYNAALSAAAMQANANGYQIPRSPETLVPLGFYEAVRFIRANIDPLPLYYYRLAEASGATMLDSSGMASPVNGTYTGTPHLGVPGPLNPRGIGQGMEDTQASFENNSGQYGAVTGLTLSGTRGGVMAWYTPDALTTNGAIVAKTVGGAINSSWLLYQEDERLAFRVKDATAAIVHYSYTMTAGDVGRPMCLLGTYDTGTLRLARNGVLVGETTYTSPVAVGAGDLFIGKLDAAGNYPAQGQIGQVVIFDGYAPSIGTLSPQTGQDDAAALFLAGTWAPGGLVVDAALTEPRQAQDWLRPLFQMRGLRLGFTATGTITCSVDATAPATIQLEARDGPGDGARTLLDIRDRQRPRMQDAVKDLVIRYRKDLLSGNYLFERRREVSTAVDAQGQRIGRDLTIDFDVVRDHTSADRVACYLAARLGLDETVAVTLTQEARTLLEGHLVQLTDAAMGYAGDVLEVTAVEKSLTEIGAVLREWGEDIYVYSPAALPVGAEPG